MNILFFTLLDFNSIEEPGIYTDLLQKFAGHGHCIFAISPIERRKRQDTHLIEHKGIKILKLKIGNMQKTNTLEKGISTVFMEPIFIRGIQKYFANVKFDLILYSTPPVTFYNAVKYVKCRDGAKTYLLLKDIFPQNAVDIGMLKISGIKGLLYKYFRKKEKKLYEISDHIGCMSQANVDYIVKHNPEIPPDIVEVCPNSIEVADMRISSAEREKMRKKYDIPLDKKIFVYGGNLGKPQGILHIIRCLNTQIKNTQAYFLIVGDGTEFGRLEQFFNTVKPDNMKLMKRLPKEDYDRMVAACDVGLIFLDHRFTIPNFPSRLLSYMQARLPILACTDKNTDIGQVIVEGGFGWWCESNDIKAFYELVKDACRDTLGLMGENGYKYLEEHYSVNQSYEGIMKHLK